MTFIFLSQWTVWTDGDEARLLRQVAQASIGAQEITHEPRHLQACADSDASTPNLQHS